MVKIGVVGSGLIGRSWAMLFAAAGYEVVMYDVDKAARERALEVIGQQLVEFKKIGLLRGSLSAEAQLKLISTTANLADVVADAKHVQECVFEDVELKKKVFREMSVYCNNDSTVLCSSTSCILPTKIFTGLERVSQCIVAHPVGGFSSRPIPQHYCVKLFMACFLQCNPPALCPLTEIVPHPETSPDVIQRTRDLMTEIGQTPVTLKKEVDGFALNRIQYSVINECWRLVMGGYMSVEDVDKVMTDGLGMRYAFIGPFETCHLNAEGTKQYMEKYAETIKRVSSSFGAVPDYGENTVAEINKEICQRVLDTREGLEQRRHWRDTCLIELAKLKKKVKTE